MKNCKLKITCKSHSRMSLSGIYRFRVKHGMTPCIIFHFTFLIFNCLYAGSSTTYTTYNQFNAGNPKENTMVFGTADADGYVNLENNFYDITNTPGPTARKWHATAYSSSKDKIVLFGGLGAVLLNDTWIYNPQTNQWTQKSPSTIPAARYGHILISSGTNKAILFGGYNGSAFFNDTWEYNFDTDNWTEVITVSSPTAAAYSCAAYDSDNNKIILFGGQYEGIKSSDTWIYHISGSSWTKGAYGPSKRVAPSGCYDKKNQKFVIFGGEGDSVYLSDTWVYNYIQNLWTLKTPDGSITSRKDTQMVFDTRNERSVLFGGSAPAYKDDIWFYDYAVNKWSNSQPSQTATARYGFSMNYISSIQKAFLFGGRDNSGDKNDFYNYVFRSSGTYTTIYFDTPFSTELYWLSVEAPTMNGEPSNTTLKFQVASSIDNSTYSDFIGYDGTSGTDFAYNGVDPTGIWNDNTKNNLTNERYLKLKFFFDTTEPPLSGTLQSVTVHFNRSPSRPSLLSPTNNFSTNVTTPDFNWYAVSDDDGDSVSYKIEIADNAGSVIISSENIATTSYSTTTILSHGTYLWWVYGYDGANYSLCSSTYTLYIDTFPPAAVTSFSASIGSYNGAINLLWTAPENTGSTGNISTGKYFVRYATYSFLTETDWQNNWSGEQTISKSPIIPGENQTFTFNGLSDATTYYFSVKTQDGTGNVSLLSSTSPFCMTNAAPQVIVKFPNGSETFSGNKTVSWTYSDPYPPDDEHKFAIYDSSDGVNFTVMITSGLPDKTTYYLWNTKTVRNSAYHKIKVAATDTRGLSGSDVSDNYFTVDNSNIAPVVSLIQPNGSEKISGSYTISFSVTDENLADTHKFTIFASTNSGYSYDIKIAENIIFTSYLWNTILYPNSPKYRIKILATDDGSPPLTVEDFSDANFEVNNNNKTPSAPVLISPLNDSYNTIAALKFVWQKSTDPNPEDLLTYTVYYSSDSYFRYANVVSGITDTEYTPTNLAENVKYYWKVASFDPFGAIAISNPFNFIASWSKDDSDDGKVRVEIDELPPGYYVKVENTSADFSAAIKDSISDRLIKYINQQAYKITVYDKNNVPQNISARGSVRFNYSDGNSDGYVDDTDIKIDNIRIANLDETKNRWEFPRAAQIIDKTKKYVKVDVEHFSYFTTVASVVPTKKVSNIVNYPNPFNPDKETTTIKYVLTESDDVLIRIFNLVGDLVYERKIDAGQEGAVGQPEGYTNEITWNGKNGNDIIAATGVYILEIKSGKDKDVRKIAAIK
ncbi:MAG: hypothetical protein COS68_05190 [Elusimicrobia bacterium CG06_land_8_20_14_3_00_38_11]|nr:MAG: hypothetical protein COS68_05190 [Elusimicrobia bacterium CG06_land_8_20_14_3_00_38_11]